MPSLRGRNAIETLLMTAQINTDFVNHHALSTTEASISLVRVGTDACESIINSILRYKDYDFHKNAWPREIGSRVGRNQTTVMRICDHWMQEGTTDQRDRSHPPQCTTSREDRQIVRMAVTNRSVPSRTVAQHIESVTHHSVSARTIRRRLQQSGLPARRQLLGLPLTQNHRRLRHQWCDERRMWAPEWNEVVFTDESRICMQHNDGRIRVWRHRGERMLNSCVMHRQAVRIAGALNSQHYISEVLESVVLPYLRGSATAIFQQDNAPLHVARIVQRFFVNHQIELLPWLARSPDLSPIENMMSMVAQ
ncbi:transposable element Tcb1 transposase [Trichonephila clavipes]|nr:transposable element Tcb1 transposase [Trichonephila clavipes]